MNKEERLKKRHNSEKRFKFYGLLSVSLALIFVLILIQNIVSKGSSALVEPLYLLIYLLTLNFLK